MHACVCLYMELFQCRLLCRIKCGVKCWEAASVLITMDVEAEAERKENEGEKRLNSTTLVKKHIPLVCFFPP